MRIAKKVLLIGWDAADWKIIQPLLDRGLMPGLERLINQGVMGNYASLHPMLSPMLWNSIATGKHADKHGILGFIEPDPRTGGARAVASTSRKTKAIWNILTQRGLRTHVLGWFGGHPAEPINGVCVSPLYPLTHGPLDQPWPLPEGSVHPERLRDTLAALRIHERELGAEELLSFVPRAAEIDQSKDTRLGILAQHLAETVSIHNAATWVLQNEPWDFLAVYYIGIDHFCHTFMPFRPPRMEHVPERLYEIYKDVVDGAYLFHDMMLQTLMHLAGDEATVMLVSDHGFHSDHLRPKETPDEHTGPTIWHRSLGVFAMKGPGVKKDERIYGATILDTTPTLLTLFGLPVARDMDGKALVQCFEDPVTPQYIESWEQEPGQCGMHSAELRSDPLAAQAMMQQFVALGYIEAPDLDQAKAAAIAAEEAKYNLAHVYMDTRRPALALPLVEELAAAKPEPRFLISLAQCYRHLGRSKDAMDALRRVLEAEGRRPRAEQLMGVLCFEEGRIKDALQHLLAAEEADPRLPHLHVRIGDTYLRMRRARDAERAFTKALAIDPDNAAAHLGIAFVRARQKRYEEAAAAALEAVGLQHFLPAGHYCLGLALARLGRYDRAATALEIALSMNPGMVAAQRLLARVQKLLAR